MTKYDSQGRISNLGQQFMPITQLKEHVAGDFDADSYTSKDQAYFRNEGQPMNIKVGELHRNMPTYKRQKYDWDRLSKDVAAEGLKEPLHVGPGYKTGEPTLKNGHHRAVTAMEQGHMFVPVTENPGNGPLPVNEFGANYGFKQSALPTRTWEPIIQEHENESRQKVYGGPEGIHPDQGQLFQHKFTDRRKKGSFFDRSGK
jgi:hypothetical protein